jgi:hypothetical protein
MVNLVMHFQVHVPIILVQYFVIAESLSENVFLLDEFDVSLNQGSDSLDVAMDNTDWISESPGFDLSDLDGDSVNSEADIFISDMELWDTSTDIIWEQEPILADATFSNVCASEVNELNLEARDEASCSPSQTEELLPSPQMLQLSEDPVGLLEEYLLPFQGETPAWRPPYPGRLPPEQEKEQEIDNWIRMNFVPPYEVEEDPCYNLRYRGFVNNVCCLSLHEPREPVNEAFNAAYPEFYRVALEGCHFGTAKFSSFSNSLVVGHGGLPIFFPFFFFLHMLMLIFSPQFFLEGFVKNPFMLVANIT